MEIHVKNPLDVSIDAAKIIAKASADIVFNIDSNFKVHGEVS